MQPIPNEGVAASQNALAWPSAQILRQQWQLDSAWTYLNHGGYGACPQSVVEKQVEWIRRLERQPIQFISRELEAELDRALARLARFVGADPADLAFVPNATTGVSTILRSLHFKPGDEILVSSHSYPSIFNAVQFIADRHGAKMVIAEIPFPVSGEEEALAALVKGMSRRTRLLVIDHITSPTGLILPLERIVAAAKSRGIEVLVDGAHGPGMLDLDLGALGADYYTGNCHKWMCAPKGAAFLWVAPDKQEHIAPLSISLGWMIQREGESAFQSQFKYTGTTDPSPILCIEAAMDFLEALPGGWEEIRRRNHALLMEARVLLCDALDVEPPAPEEMLGSLCTLPLPDGRADLLESRLTQECRIEVPIYAWPFRPRVEPGRRLIRISPQVYNDIEQYGYLARCLLRCLAEE